MPKEIEWDEFDSDGAFPETKVKFTTPNDSVAGTIVNVRITDFGGKGERTPELWIDTGTEQVSVVASQIGLRRKLSELRPKVGDRIAIVYTGDGQSSQAGFSPPKLFDVIVKPAEETAEPAAQPAAAAVTASNLI